MSHTHIRPLWILLVGFCLSTPLTLLNAPVVWAQDTEGPSATDQRSSTTDDEVDRDGDDVVRYPEAEEEEEVPGDNSIEPRRVSPANKEKLQRRAGEKIAGDARGRAVILGMQVQEAGNERVKVVEVAPTSTAYEAGIRAGDEIISFDGFKAKTYRDWIDGIRRITTDSPDGTELPVKLVRGGKQFDVELKVPIATVGALRGLDESVQQTTVVEGQPQVNLFAGRQPMPVRGDNDDVLIANAFGDDFINREAGATESAIAEIFRVNQPPTPNANTTGAVRGDQRNVQTAQARAPSQAVPEAAVSDSANGTGARIGLAGFRDDANGMFVMLDVGGLPAGNYTVGIGDPSALMGAGSENVPLPRNPRPTPGTLEPTAPDTTTPADRPIIVPRNRSGAAPSDAPATQPARPGAAGGNPQSSIEPALPQKVEIPRAILAQVTDTPADTGSATPAAGPTNVPATGSAEPLDTPPTGTTEPLDTPPTGTVNPIDATPTGRPRIDPRDVVDDRSAGAGATAPSMQIGTLTVDQSGTGRMQQVVEGVRVQDVIGQALLIHSQSDADETTLPPNLDTTADPADAATTQSGSDLQRVREQAAARTANAEAESRSANARNAAPPDNVADNTLVAGGVIRSMSSPLPTTGAGRQVTPNEPLTTEEQPPAETQNRVPQNTAVPPAPGRPTR